MLNFGSRRSTIFGSHIVQVLNIGREVNVIHNSSSNTLVRVGTIGEIAKPLFIDNKDGLRVSSSPTLLSWTFLESTFVGCSTSPKVSALCFSLTLSPVHMRFALFKT